MPHITGLRGLAILAVVLYHFLKNDADVQNFYFGVNLFFVITGYFLFASFLKPDFSFSLGDFCRKKLIRLFPPFIAVIVGAMLISMVVYPSDTIFKAARYGLFSLIGYSNYYYNDSLNDYFSVRSDQVVLLMTWYFSVLLQVYVLYALASMLLKRFSAAIRLAAVVVVLLLSLAATYPPSEWAVLFGPGGGGAPSDYFSTFCRLWIVLAGALATLLPEIRSTALRNTVHLTSLAVLVGMMLGHYAFPMQDIPAVIACALCVRYAPSGIAAYPLCNPLMAGIGLISFSLYLVHWPLIVFTRYIDYTPSMACYAALVLVILILSILLYRFVEAHRFAVKTVVVSWLASMALVLVLVGTHGLHGVLHRSILPYEPVLYTDHHPVPDEHPTMQGFPKQYMWKVFPGLGGKVKFPHKPHALYFLGDESKTPEFILMGDSHANAFYAGFASVAKREGWSGVYAQAYVMPYVNYCNEIAHGGPWTREKAEALVAYLAAHPELHTVVLGQYWAYQFGLDSYLDWSGKLVDNTADPELNYQRLRGFLLMLKQAGKKVVVLHDVPIIDVFDYLDEVNKEVVLGRPLDMSRYSVTREAYDQLNAPVYEIFRRLEEEGLITVLNTQDVLFRNGTFCALSDRGSLYTDHHHMGWYGAEMMVESVKEEFSAILRKNAAESAAK